MARRKPAAATIAPRKPLLEWIEDDDDDSSFVPPACSATVRALHARMPLASAGSPVEPLPPPPGLHLAPLG